MWRCVTLTLCDLRCRHCTSAPSQSPLIAVSCMRRARIPAAAAAVALRHAVITSTVTVCLFARFVQRSFLAVCLRCRTITISSERSCEARNSFHRPLMVVLPGSVISPLCVCVCLCVSFELMFFYMYLACWFILTLSG